MCAAAYLRSGHMPVRPDAAASADKTLFPNFKLGNTVPSGFAVVGRAFSSRSIYSKRAVRTGYQDPASR
jgi:hypothetical protein